MVKSSASCRAPGSNRSLCGQQPNDTATADAFVAFVNHAPIAGRTVGGTDIGISHLNENPPTARSVDKQSVRGSDGSMDEGPRTVTMLLRDWRAGDRAAFDEVIPLIYGELHKLASGYLRGERAGHTLRPTDLVSEAYLRLADADHPEWNDRAHFQAIAARTMRQILVDHARKRNAVKRGDGEQPITLDEGLVTVERPEAMIALDAALSALEEFDERKARVIELHYFGGLTQEEVAGSLGVHVNTVGRDLRVAEAWIHRHLRGEP